MVVSVADLPYPQNENAVPQLIIEKSRPRESDAASRIAFDIYR